MRYEIQMEQVPGNNQVWIVCEEPISKLVCQHDTLEAAQAHLLVLENQHPQHGFRIFEKEA
jgi:hypothetical protein